MKENNNDKLSNIDTANILKFNDQISLTNKLLKDELYYSNWWSNLDSNWQEIFKRLLVLQRAKLNLKNAHHKLNNSDDYSFNDNELYLINNLQNGIDITILRYLLSCKKLTIYSDEEFSHINLKPLTELTNLEHIEFINIQVINISPLFCLDKLKTISFDIEIRDINQIEIDRFQQNRPECEIKFT